MQMYGDSLVGLTVGYIVAILFFYSFVYRPAILQMDKDMRRTRSMLLVFPDEVCAPYGRTAPFAHVCMQLYICIRPTLLFYRLSRALSASGRCCTKLRRECSRLSPTQHC